MYTLSDEIKRLTDLACIRHGAYKVRLAALRQMGGEMDALATVGLGTAQVEGLIYSAILEISTNAHFNMTPEEQMDEFCKEKKCEKPDLDFTQVSVEFTFRGTNAKENTTP